MKNTKRIWISLVAILVIFQSCSKGTQGPAGAAGATGATGATGAQGPQGQTGSANVIYSDWFMAKNWLPPASALLESTFDKAAPSITTAIMNNGVTLTYVKIVEDSGAVRQLPLALFTINYTSFYGFKVPGPGVLRLTFNDISGGSIPDTAIQYRYVVIPGAVAGGRSIGGPAAGYSADQLKKMTYEQVAILFKIPAKGSNE